MAEKRTIHKKISLSEAVDDMKTEAQLLFTWSIPHADDVGVLPRSAKTMKGLVFPLKEISSEDVEEMIQECISQGLYAELEHNRKQYLLVKNFGEHQTLRKDRQPQTILDLPLKQKPDQNWQVLDNLIDSHLSDIRQSNGSQCRAEVKGREVKGSEGKGSEAKAPARKPKTDDDKEEDIYDVPFFKEFWEEYPKKTGKGATLTSWKKLKISKTKALQIIASVVAHTKTKQWKEENGRFIPNPATFLNQRRFDDEVDQATVDQVANKYAHLS